jgi:hypothetical protein
MSGRGPIVEQFEMFQKEKKGVYLFSMDKRLGDDLNNCIISDTLKNAFKTNGVSLSEKTNISKENEDKMVISDREKKNTFFVKITKEDKELSVYNSVNKYERLELPERVLMRTKNARGEFETIKEPKSRVRRMVPPTPEEGIGGEDRKYANLSEEYSKSEVNSILNSLKEDVAASKKLDPIYYLEMAVGGIIFGFSIIFYQALGPMAIPIIIFGLGVFFTSFASKRRIDRKRKEHGF